MKSRRITHTAGYALALVAVANALSLLDRNIIAILAPRIKKDLSIGDAEMGLLYGSVFALFYALFSLPIGRLADTWVRTRLLGIALAFWSMATALAAGAHGFGLLALSRLGVGIGEGAAVSAGTSLAFDHYPKSRRGFAMSVIAASIAVGLGGSLILGGLAADWWDRTFAAGGALGGLKGWQFAFLLAALPGFVFAVLLWRMPEPVRGRLDGVAAPAQSHPLRSSLALLAAATPISNWVVLWRRGAPAASWAVNATATILIVAAAWLLTRAASAFAPRPALHFGSLCVNPHALQWSIAGFGAWVVVNVFQSLKVSDPPAYAILARTPSLILCMAVGSLQMIINYGVMGFTPSFLMKQYGLSPSSTGLQFGLLSAALGVIGPLIAGPLSDRINARWPGSGRAGVTLAALGLSPLIGLWVYRAGSAAEFYGRFVLYSLVLTAWLPPLYAMLYDQVLPRMRGLTASIYVIVYTIFGLGIGPYTVGMISDANGGNLAKAIVSINWVAPVIVILLVALMRRVRRDEGSLIARARAAGEPV